MEKKGPKEFTLNVLRFKSGKYITATLQHYYKYMNYYKKPEFKNNDIIKVAKEIFGI